MEKVLLKITQIQGSICQPKNYCENTQERERAAAFLLSIMDQDEALACEIIHYVTTYFLHRKEVAMVNKISMASAKKKTKVS